MFNANKSIDGEIRERNAIVELFDNGKTHDQIVSVLYGNGVSFCGKRSHSDKVAAMALYMEGVGQIHPLDRNRFGAPASSPVTTNVLTKNNGIVSYSDTFGLVDTIVDVLGVPLVPSASALTNLPEEWGQPPPQLLPMLIAMDLAKSKNFLDEESDSLSPVLYQRLVVDRGLIVDNKAYRSELLNAARIGGVVGADEELNDTIIYDSLWRHLGMGANVAPRGPTPRLGPDVLTTKMIDQFKAQPLLAKCLLLLELPKHLLLDEQVTPLDITNATEESITEYVSRANNSQYAKFMVQRAKTSGGCVGRRKDIGWEDDHYLHPVFVSALGPVVATNGADDGQDDGIDSGAIRNVLIIHVLSFVVPEPRFDGNCCKLSGIGSTEASRTRRVGILELLEAAHAEEGTEKPTDCYGKTKNPSDCNFEELNVQDIVMQCRVDHRRDTACYFRQRTMDTLTRNNMTAYVHQAAQRLKNQKDINTIKVSAFGGRCVSPGCNSCITDPASPMCQVMEMQHVAGKSSVVIEQRDGTRFVMIKTKVTALSTIGSKISYSLFVASILTEFEKTLPLCTAHHKLIDKILDQDLVRSFLNYQECILLSDGSRVNGHLIRESTIDSDLTELLHRVEALHPGYVENVLRPSPVLKQSIPPNYVASVQDGNQPAHTGGAAVGGNTLDADDGSLGNVVPDGLVGMDVLGFDNGDGEDELNEEGQADGNAENVPPNQWVLPDPEVRWRTTSTLYKRSTVLKYDTSRKKHRVCLSQRH